MADLTTNAVLADTLLHATQAALRTGHDEKRDALRTTVLYAALPKAPDESLQLILLSRVDEITG